MPPDRFQSKADEDKQTEHASQHRDYLVVQHQLRNLESICLNR